MNCNKIESQKNLTILTINEVASKLKLTDADATKRWLTKNNISIQKIGKQNIVYEIDVDCALDLPYVRILQKKYPFRWEDAYRTVVKDESVFQMVLMEINSTTIRTPLSKVKATNDKEKKLLERLNT